MNDVSEVESLGAVRARYEVAKARMFVVATLLILLGIPSAVFAAHLLDIQGSLAGDARASAEQAITFSMILAGIGLLGGPLVLATGLRGGLGEFFEIRDHGLVHGSVRRARGWRWDQVSTVDVNHAPRSTALSRFFGTDRSCVVRFDDGGRVLIDDRTQGREALEDTVRRNCPHAGPQPDSEKRRFGVGWLLAGVALIAGSVGGFGYFVTRPDEREVQRDGFTEIVPAYSDTQIALVSIGLVLCLAAGLVCVNLYFMTRKNGTT